MKTQLFIAISGLILSASAFAQESKPADILAQAQDKIITAFEEGRDAMSADALLQVEQQLQAQPANMISTYWLSFCRLYAGILYMSLGDSDQAEQYINQSVSLMEKLEKKNAESYALLSYAQTMSIQFVKGLHAASVSKKATTAANKALELDPDNVRAHYAAGLLDYYTPAMYGGQRKCEEHFLKAVRKQPESVANPYLPTWGQEDAYVLLITYYVNNGKKDKAKELYRQAVERFPEEKDIRQMSKVIE